MKQLNSLRGALLFATLTLLLAGCNEGDDVRDPNEIGTDQPTEEPVGEEPDKGGWWDSYSPLKIEADGIELSNLEVDGKENEFCQVGVVPPEGCETFLTFPDLQNDESQLPKIVWISLEFFSPWTQKYEVSERIYPSLNNLTDNIKCGYSTLTAQVDNGEVGYKLEINECTCFPQKSNITFEYHGKRVLLTLSQEIVPGTEYPYEIDDENSKDYL